MRYVTALVLAAAIVVSGLPTQASTAGAIESERPTARVTEFATGLLGGDACCADCDCTYYSGNPCGVCANAAHLPASNYGPPSGGPGCPPCGVCAGPPHYGAGCCCSS